MLAEVVHSAADFANQALLAYGLSSSRRAPDAIHPRGRDNDEHEKLELWRWHKETFISTTHISTYA
ncbi:unnamed protein product, partial [Vitis vinifera]|uniref:Metal tolerance protein C4 n=1 Tax=Vitis vinifera TaxID=29760 RepID=D7SS49_VITVI